MAKDYFVAYGASAPSVELVMLLDGLNAVPVWNLGESGAWLIRSERSAALLRDELAPHLGKGANLFIGQLIDGACHVEGHRDPIREYQQRFPD